MISGRPVGEHFWISVYRDLQKVIEELELTFFEATTLMAFELFKREGVDWAVIETGLGGRFDSTNVAAPRVSVITHLAMDHMEFLGDTLDLIAMEKLGIVKRETPLVMVRPDDEAVRALVLQRCAEMHAPCVFTPAEIPGDADYQGSRFQWNGSVYRVNLCGKFQRQNAVSALEALSAAGFTDQDRIGEGIANTWLPGRFQVISLRGKTIVFDVGHNPDAAETFCSSFAERYGSRKATVVLGIMRDKDFALMIPHYSRIAERLIFARPQTGRAADPETLLKQVPADFSGVALTQPTVASAVVHGLQCQADVLCVAGSFFTVGEAMGFLETDPYACQAIVTC
jgi:dihydrofolate synthase/folylpolyglutamate synthase